ncbi:hypothetical protein OGAPHI_004646 [Ogataea philodendri]|uniref:Uncharacterized protein n=1 Tax=Ogataea philodendri TaxID=1378263 RepID=A0A9P8T3K9_9ASCO|nr:uncharacterized protein OGAPHI_004646 [Ogataea philodendri]KAH3664294.1 hypothetical protein OGAPHI_004646 [Ogataea philodendri]
MLYLGLQQVEQSNTVGRELSNTIRKLLGGHCVLVEQESEGRLVIDVGDLLFLGGAGGRGIQNLWNRLLRIDQLLQKLWSDGQEVATGESSDLTNISERSTHDNGLVSVLLVVVEDLGHGLDTWVLLTFVSFTGVSLVPVHNSSNEWRN